MPIICPRCGEKGTLVKSPKAGRVYYKVRHGKRGNYWYCYLGPEDYVYATRTHDLVLHGYPVKNRYLLYLQDLLNHIPKAKPEDLKPLLPLLKKAIQEIENTTKQNNT